MSTSTKSLSASQMAVRFGVQENTARLFMQKVREAMKSSGDFPMTGVVNVDEYVVGGYQEGKPGRSYDTTKKKGVCTVELTDGGKVKRFTHLKFQIILQNLCVKYSISSSLKRRELQQTNGKVTILLLMIMI